MPGLAGDRSGAPAVHPPESRREREPGVFIPSRRALPPLRQPDAETAKRDITRLLPPYRVLLHNDDHNTMDHVVRAIVESVPTISVDRAVEIMYEAHNSGVAEVIRCPLEPAELYRDRLKTFGLKATIEKA